MKETKMAAPSAETRAALTNIIGTFEAYKAANDARLAEIERKSSADVLSIQKVNRIDAALTEQKAALDRLTLHFSAAGLGGAADIARADERKAAFDAYVRKGDAHGLLETKDLSAGAPAEGGYLVPDGTARLIGRRLAAISPIRAIASVVEVGVNQFRKPISLNDATAGWVAETGARAGTTEPTINLLDFPTPNSTPCRPRPKRCSMTRSSTLMNGWLMRSSMCSPPLKAPPSSTVMG